MSKLTRLRARLQRFPRPFSLPSGRLRGPSFMLVSITLALVAVGVAVSLLNSPIMEINNIDVEGADVVSEASIRQLAGLKGEHVLLADSRRRRSPHRGAHDGQIRCHLARLAKRRRSCHSGA